MHRRQFIAGCGALATGGVAHAALQDQRFAINPLPVGLIETADPGVPQGLFLGYVPGSAELQVSELAVTQSGWRDLLPAERRAEMSIRRLVAAAKPSIQRLDVTIHFALADASGHVPFHAWQFVAAPGALARQSSPIAFTSGVPESALVAIAYRVQNPYSGQTADGVLHYRIGGSGLGPGVYALAGPSASTGGAPDWSQLSWQDEEGALVRHNGGAIDFDYLALALAPATA
jgi:hypothetical protein